jgi:hypothetical protein
MFLVFKGNGIKWYAKTPDGEIAISDHGIYQWYHNSSGELCRIQFTGGDTQASNPEGRYTTHARPEPNQRGLMYAAWMYKYGVN